LCATIQTREILNLHELSSSLQSPLTKLYMDFYSLSVVGLFDVVGSVFGL